jgi:hypothetical protein
MDFLERAPTKQAVPESMQKVIDFYIVQRAWN